MENRKDFRYFLLRLTADSLVVLVSWFLSYYLRFHIIPGSSGSPFLFFTKVSLLILVIYVYALNKNKLYESMRNYSRIQEVQLLVYSAVSAEIAIVLVFYFFFPERVSRLSLGIFGLLSLFGLIIERTMVNQYLVQIRKKGKNIKTVLLIGYGPYLNEYYDRMVIRGGTGLQVIGQADYDGGPIKHIRQMDQDVLHVVETFKPDLIVISYPAAEYQTAQNQLNLVSESFSHVIFIPSVALSSLGTKITNFYNLPMVHVNHVNFNHFDRMKKRIMDISISLVGLILLSPLFLVIAILVKLSSRGPVFYSQQRVTINEKLFSMIKFRTMKNSTSSEVLQWTTKNDSRCTRIGALLRKTSLDELPQLVNVLKGDMSLIGPRPERKEFVDKFNREILNYRLRHKVKTGISGWAQVNGLRGDTSIVDRVDSDLYYIRNWSIGLDIKILIMTFFKGFVNKNAY